MWSTRPSRRPEQEIDRARRIVAAFAEAESAGSAAFKLDGVMIDYPVVDKARRLLAGLRDRTDTDKAA